MGNDIVLPEKIYNELIAAAKALDDEALKANPFGGPIHITLPGNEKAKLDVARLRNAVQATEDNFMDADDYLSEYRRNNDDHRANWRD